MINTKDIFVKKFDFLVELRQIPTTCFLGLFQESKCSSLRPGIISPVVGFRLTRLTHGLDPNSSRYDVHTVIPQDKFFLQLEPGPSPYTTLFRSRSLIPYPVEVRL